MLFHIFAFFNIVVLATVLLFPAKNWTSLLWKTSAVLWLLQLTCHLSHAGFYSFAGIAPTCIITAMILGLCQCISLQNDWNSRRPLYSALFLILLALMSLIPDGVSHDSFMVTYIFAILFFLSRPLSLGFTLFSLAGMADLLTSTGNNARIRKTSKDAAFMASIIFLGGEIIGCYWGFLGWGTTWRWSGNFQYSAMLFVLFMVSLHIPSTLFRTKRTHDLFFSLPLACIALCIVLGKVIS